MPCRTLVSAIALFVLGCGSAGQPKATADAGVCSRPQQLAAPSPEVTFASGSLTGPSLNALVCAVAVDLISAGAGGFLGQFGWEPTQPRADFQSPTAATLGLVEANIGVGAAVPGSYSSSDGSCGSVTISYHFPVVPSADCAGATVPCPAGCAPSCADGGCESCVQFQSEQIFEARGTSNCVAPNALQPVGSWSLNLSSVTPAGQGYTVHGSLFAVLGDPFGPDSASLALAF